MGKICIFCGGKPSGKTKEHVIPQWLISMTGKPNRKASLGYIKDFKSGFKQREYSFSKFTFPSCDSCNNKYSKLEEVAKSVTLKILNKENLYTEEISQYLNWLDKVRVGLWLGMNMLDKNYASVSPNFHIDTRIGQFDRLLIIQTTDDETKKLIFSGVDTYSFALTPSAFTLRINQYCFTNISSMFLISRRIGYPYPESMYVQSNDERIGVNFAKARERLMTPILRKRIPENGPILFQPMFAWGLGEGSRSYYDTSYVKKHCMDFNDGAGNIYKEDETGKTIEYSKGEEINIQPIKNLQNNKFHIQNSINICSWQNWLTDQLPKLDKLTPKQKKFVKSRFGTGKKINNMLIKHFKEQL